MFFKLFPLINLLGGWLKRFDYPSSITLNNRLSHGRNLDHRDLNFKTLLPPPFVKTELGSYNGYFMKVISGRNIYAFEGIPYAEPPQRFKAPQKKRPFYGNFSALSYGEDCLQTYYGTVVSPKGIVFGSENCLTCNIYSPMISVNASFPSLPVILNFYGGSFAVGSSNDYGPAYLLEKDMVLVNCNYRVGVLGFLSTGDATAPGNWGLKDVSMALDFVHENIKYFGGSPQKIVLLGQSAGAVLVHLLTLSPVAHEGKIFGAICLSGNALTEWAVEDPLFAKRKTLRFALMNFCPTNQGSQAMIECLRKRNPRRLAALQNLIHVTEMSPFQFIPVVEPLLATGTYITDTPENIYRKRKLPKIPMIFTMNSQDSDILLMITRALKINARTKLSMKAILEFLPDVGGYREKVGGRERDVFRNIVDFYGGIEVLENNPQILFRLLQDRLFATGLWKSLRLHSKVGPTYGITFSYKTSRGFAARLNLNPNNFGVPHSEDLVYMFNRTDIEPISKKDDDYEIVKLFQSIFQNFLNYGKLQYESDFGDTVQVQPVDATRNKFSMFVIDKESHVVEMKLKTNWTTFWDNVGINEFPSL